MADFADLGADREERDRALALKVRAPEGPSATGMSPVLRRAAGRWVAVVRRRMLRCVAGRAAARGLT